VTDHGPTGPASAAKFVNRKRGRRLSRPRVAGSKKYKRMGADVFVRTLGMMHDAVLQ
jgi:hypothetical protein